MIQCKDCEFYSTTPAGNRIFSCNPFENIKEPECIQKWSLIKLDLILAGQMRMVQGHDKLAPLQDKIMKYMEKEIEDLEETDKWKYNDEDDENEENDNYYF